MKSAPWKGRDGSGRAHAEETSPSLSPCCFPPRSLVNISIPPIPAPLLLQDKNPARRTSCPWLDRSQAAHHGLWGRDVLPCRIHRGPVLVLASSSQRQNIEFVPWHYLTVSPSLHKRWIFNFSFLKTFFFLWQNFVASLRCREASIGFDVLLRLWVCHTYAKLCL